MKQEHESPDCTGNMSTNTVLRSPVLPCCPTPRFVTKCCSIGQHALTQASDNTQRHALSPVKILWLCDSVASGSCCSSGMDGYCCEGSPEGPAAAAEEAGRCINSAGCWPSACACILVSSARLSAMHLQCLLTVLVSPEDPASLLQCSKDTLE